jgi:hypothetical protein
MILGIIALYFHPERTNTTENNMPVRMENLMGALVYPDYCLLILEQFDQNKLDNLIAKNRGLLKSMIKSSKRVTGIRFFNFTLRINHRNSVIANCIREKSEFSTYCDTTQYKYISTY